MKDGREKEEQKGGVWSVEQNRRWVKACCATESRTSSPQWQNLSVRRRQVYIQHPLPATKGTWEGRRGTGNRLARPAARSTDGPPLPPVHLQRVDRRARHSPLPVPDAVILGFSPPEAWGLGESIGGWRLPPNGTTPLHTAPWQLLRWLVCRYPFLVTSNLTLNFLGNKVQLTLSTYLINFGIAIFYKMKPQYLCSQWGCWMRDDHLLIANHLSHSVLKSDSIISF